MATDIEIRIDGRPEELPVGSFGTLDDVVGVLVRRLVPTNRYVAKIMVNGQDLTEENQSRMAAIALGDIRKIEVTTEPVSEGVIGALDRAVAYLDRLCEGIRVCVEKYRGGEDLEAHRLLAECLEGLGWFVSFASNVKIALHLNYDEEYFHGETLTVKQDRLYEYIRELEKAQKNTDLVYMADLLEYEIEPLVKGWKEVFPAFRERVTGSPS